MGEAVSQTPCLRIPRLEIRQVYEADDFGPELTPELREQEERLRKQLAAKARASTAPRSTHGKHGTLAERPLLADGGPCRWSSALANRRLEHQRELREVCGAGAA